MIQCPDCGQIYCFEAQACPGCGFSPSRIGDFIVWDPETVAGGEGFKPEFFKELASLEAGHFWFRVRNNLILYALGQYCPDFKSFHEVGCGTGFVLAAISKAYPRAQLSGSEYFSAGLACAAERVSGVELMQFDARRIPFVEEFDVMGAFDVLEHIEEDEEVLAQVYRALKPGGKFLLTVPQHMRLWSSVDEQSCHVRRYDAKDLHSKLIIAGFKINRSTSFVSILLPIMFASRYVSKTKNVINTLDELRINPFLNQVLELVLVLDLLLIRMGINLPVGGTRLVVAEKVDI
jgi:SAM-dependent methyltransferase